MTTTSRRGSVFSTAMTFLCLSVLIGGAAVVLRPCLFPSERDRQVAEIIRGLDDRESATLEKARKLAEAYPDDLLALALHAEAAAINSEHELAIKLFDRLEAAGGKWAFRAHLGRARRFEILGRLARSEHHLKRALEIAPHDLDTNNHLSYLLHLQGRCWEGAPHYFVQIREGKCRGDELLGMASVERFFVRDERLERLCPEMDPQELLINLPLARTLIYSNQLRDAEKLLRDLVAVRPDLGEAQGRLGRIITDRGNTDEFLQWLVQIPPEARDHPEVWFVQGLHARRLGQLDGAVNCFIKTLTLSPNHLSANLQMSNCLERVGEQEAAAAFGRRAELLAEFETALSMLRFDSDPNLVHKVAELLAKTGRYWEASGWAQVMLRLRCPHDVPRRQLGEWLKLARAEPGPNAPSMLPIRLLKRRDYPSPRWPATKVATIDQPRAGQPSAGSPRTAWNLVDDAERLGIKFEYYEGTNEEKRMEHIFNTMGGGLGAIDYDNDGWPDLYLAQANNWRDPAPQPDYRDRLFRNQIAEQFQDVTDVARLNELSFSHGVNAGDFNQDGFIDLYIGNKGPNRLFLNNGDGTFDDVTEESGTAGNEWSTSSVFADLTGDGLPELFVLNYTLLKETAEKECRNHTGVQVACTPDLLIPEADRLYLNLGDGTFRDISKESGIDLPTGKGLGIVAWDYQGNGKLGLFVANDTSPNFLFLPSDEETEGVPKFNEVALVRGVAVDLDGKAQASMGVAAGDVNHDGRIDLFVTTFFGESKTLFSQRSDGFFDDLSRPFNLRNPGFWMLGFGCQFLDADGDGLEDLIATNGHVDQRSFRGDPDRMPPQIFLNKGGIQFAEVPRAELGKFFQGNYLGRGLAKFDWNRDGRTDVGISHLHSPFALLTNRTPPIGRPLAVKLIGRKGSREAFGATVRVVPKLEGEKPVASTSPSGGQADLSKQPGTLVRLHTGGNGFLVTNEHLLHFSTPPGTSAVELEVRWLDGTVQRWSDVAPGREILVIEGARSPLVMKEYE